MSEYSPAETKMILCMTRERTCTPDKCLKCGWLKDETKAWLKEEQDKWARRRQLNMKGEEKE
jgi:hypothetical protein